MGLSPLAPLSSLDSFYSNDPTNPNSAFYVPPSGTYQNNAGQLVPNSTASQKSSLSAATILQAAKDVISHPIDTATGGITGGFKLPSLEDSVFIILGLLLIAAGVFAFKQTQTIIETGTRLARVAGEAAA